MATEIVEIGEGENPSENSVQPEAISKCRRHWFVKRKHMSGCVTIPAAGVGWTALGRGADSHFRRGTMNDWPGRVSRIIQNRGVVRMGFAVFNRMPMMAFMA